MDLGALGNARLWLIPGSNKKMFLITSKISKVLNWKAWMEQSVQKYIRNQNLQILNFMPGTSYCGPFQPLCTQYTQLHVNSFSLHSSPKKIVSIMSKVILLENTLTRGNLIFILRRCQNKSLLFLLCLRNRTFSFSLKCHLRFWKPKKKCHEKTQVVLLFWNVDRKQELFLALKNYLLQEFGTFRVKSFKKNH